MIRCTAIDDEPIALSIIKEYASRYGEIELSCFTSPVEGMEHIERTRPDVVFLDIEMTSHNGLELARRLPEGTVLIFTTAFSEYALEGFNVNAVDFLHKPIFYQRFEQAMEKAKAWLERKADSKPAQEWLTLKAEHKNVSIAIDSIAYIEAMDNYVKVYRKDLPTVVSQITMKEIQGMLPADGFARAHRSFIVPLKEIDRFSNRLIYLHNATRTIPVGRTYNDAFQQLFNSYQGTE